MQILGQKHDYSLSYSILMWFDMSHMPNHMCAKNIADFAEILQNENWCVNMFFNIEFYAGFENEIKKWDCHLKIES